MPRSLLPVLCLLLAITPARALEPKDIIVLVNKNVPESRQVADHYCLKRAVPKENVVVLDLPAGEDITRRDYDRRLKAPLREALKDRRDKVKVLLSTYGVPLRVGRIESTKEEKAQLAKIQPELKKHRTDDQRLQKEITDLEAKAKAGPKGEAAAALKERRRERDALQLKIRVLDQRQGLLSHAQTEASVDSELMLLWWDDYNLYRWQANPLYFQVPEKEREAKPPVLMVSRLDGPSAALAMKLVDSAIAVEKKGLTGKVYVDARGIKYNLKSDSSGAGYGGYDESLREMAKLLEKEGGLSVVLDDKPGLFAPGSCPDCALYCGWYSLANYIDCCRFVPGAVAYHIASAEAVSLRNPKAKFWCKNLLDNGVIATLGPVAEPYTIGFPKPAEFFGFLATGRYTLVECYSRSVMLISWMTVLVGDPLYNPFARNPRLKTEQVRPSPAGSRVIK
ncbi:MAG: TIGR03790 family protein [Gemmataceae bacterium]|nr:TIGR03790 family protein [Gemmataceae bacterium]